MKKIGFLFSLLAMLAMRPAHPLKMCVCQVKSLPETEQLSLVFRFFWDDLERALSQQSGRDLHLTNINAENNRLLSDMVQQQFDLRINGQPMRLRLVQSTVEDVVLVVEFVVDHFPAASVYDVDLGNQILLDAFSDQYNIVRFDFFGNGNLETMRFERAERRLVKRIVKR